MIEYIRRTQSAEEQIKDLFGEVYLVGIDHDENERTDDGRRISGKKKEKDSEQVL